MKRVNNLYSKICDIDLIMNMYDKTIRVNTKNKKKIQQFDNFYTCNIAKIKETLIKKEYIPGKYHIFMIHEPKARIIMSQEIEDKLINHLVAKYFLIDVFDKTLSNRNCATRIGKGTHYALKLFKQDYNYYLNKYRKFYILKLDIAKYFYNLNHDIIMKLVKRKIKDKEVLKIINIIINSTDEDYINEEIIKLKNNERNKILKSKINNNDKIKKIKEIDQIPLYKKGKGVCIGNMVSQIVATFYLDEMDKYIQEKLNITAYGRYMDDFYCMHESKQYLKYCLCEITELLRKYDLKLNTKTKIYNSAESIEYLGFMFSSNNNNIRMKLTNKGKKKFKNKMKRKNKELENNIIAFDEYRQVRESYRGHLIHGNCYRLFFKNVIKFEK
ncbi:MAG: RNA-directed DNA polymerase [Clostridia bacterium]|nr:RNA-directed DNA polymerase [Clostridia bacterium]